MIAKLMSLHENPIYMSSLLDQITDAVIATDEHFVITGWNQAAERLYGWRADEVIGQPVSAVLRTEYPYHQAPTVLANFQRSGKWSGEVLQRKRDGSKFYMFSSVTAVHDEQGRFIGALAINRDMTERKQAEQMESFFAQIFDESLNEIYIFHADTGQLIHVNRAARENSGYRIDELRKMRFIQLYDDQQEPPLDDLLPALRADARGARIYSHLRRKDSSPYPVEMSLQFMMYGNLPIFIAIALDITQRKKVEDALRASERLYRALIESQIDFVCRYTPDTILTFINEAYCRFFGKTKEELLGHSFLDFSDKDQHPIIHARLEELRRDPSPRVREIRNTRPDGAIHWVQWVDHGIVDDHGRLVMIQAVGRDITALKKAQEQFRAMLEAAADAILLVRHNGDIVLANTSTQRLFGYPLAELLRNKVDMLLPNHLQARHSALRATYQANPIARPMGHGSDLYGRRADDSLFPIEVNLSPIEVDGEQLVMCIISDVTERRQAQAERLEAERLRLELDSQRQLIAMKEDFISVVSHEFRTPLTVIQSSKEILQLYHDRLTPERRQQHLRKIGDQVAYMRELLDQVLMIGRMRQNKLDFQPRLIDVSLFCQDLFEQARLEGTERHRWTLDISPDVGHASLDMRLLQHILTNLLSNAVKYSPHGGEVRLMVRREGDTLLFVVSDEGIGIPPADQERLFETFFRAKNVGEIRGTGLGLAIVRESVALHQGAIHFSSEVGRGTRFEVRLPAAPPLPHTP